MAEPTKRAERINGAAAQRHFKAAHAIGDDWGLTAKACLEALDPIPQSANLGFLYTTAGFSEDLGSILTFLRERTGVVDWVGTVGLGIAASGVEVHGQPALAILIASLPSDSFRIFQPLIGSAQGLSAGHAEWLERQQSLLGVVHGDPRNGSSTATRATATCRRSSGSSRSRYRLFSSVA